MRGKERPRDSGASVVGAKEETDPEKLDNSAVDTQNHSIRASSEPQSEVTREQCLTTDVSHNM